MGPIGKTTKVEHNPYVNLIAENDDFFFLSILVYLSTLAGN